MKKLVLALLATALLTNAPAANPYPGPASQARPLPPSVVTNLPFLSPMMFGAAGDGRHNDTAAFAALLASIKNSRAVIDLQGKTCLITNGFTLPVGDITVQNGAFIVPSNFIGAVLVKNSTNGSPIAGGGTFDHLSFGLQGTNAPDPSTVAIQTGCYGTKYANDVTITYCNISNFWRGITVVNTPQFQITHNFIGCVWSNAVYVALPGNGGFEGGDESLIAFNDFNPGDILGAPQIHYFTNHLNVIQLDGYCAHLTVMDNNIGYGRQMFKTSPTAGGEYTFIDGEWESFLGTGGTFPIFEFWNSTVHWLGGHVAQEFGVTTNYNAVFGLYATRGSHLNFGKCLFANGNYGAWPVIADIWSADGPFNPIDGMSLPDMQVFNGGSFVLHTNWGDRGLVIPANFGTIITTYRPIASGLNVVWPLLPGATLNLANALTVHSTGAYVEFPQSPDFDRGAAFLQPVASDEYGDRQGHGMLSSRHAQYLILSSTASGTEDWALIAGVDYLRSQGYLTNAQNVLIGNHGGPTNATAPADPVTPKAWINFTNTTGGVFKIPLYQ